MLPIEFESKEQVAELRLNNFQEILINNENRILFEGREIALENLSSTIVRNTPLNKYLKFELKWGEKTNESFIKQVFYEISIGYLGLVENSLNIDICKLSQMELNVLKRKYPLRIVFRDLNFIRLPMPENL